MIQKYIIYVLIFQNISIIKSQVYLKVLADIYVTVKGKLIPQSAVMKKIDHRHQVRLVRCNKGFLCFVPHKHNTLTSAITRKIFILK